VLAKVYPEHRWDPLKFLRAPSNFWAEKENQKAFLDFLAKKFGFKDGEMEGWYKVSHKMIIENGGSGLLKRFDGSFQSLLESIYPDFKWDPLKFIKAPMNYWDSMENQRKFMENLSIKLGIHGKDDEVDKRWYKLTHKMLLENGGNGLLLYFKGSIPNMISSIFPELKFELWKFSVRSERMQKAPQSEKEMLDFVEAALDLKLPLDWLRVDQDQLTALGVSRFLKFSNGSLFLALKSRYPNENWSEIVSRRSAKPRGKTAKATRMKPN